MHFWMDGAQATLKYRRSTNQATGWEATQTIGTSGTGNLIDPTLAAHFTNGHVYFGWVQAAGTADVGIQFRRSPSGDTLDSGFEVVDGAGADRPWLAANGKSVYSTFFVTSATDKANIRKAPVNSDGTMG